ncbi:MAG: 2'-5' RNA ligase family protein [Acidobacteria bacterium]|nr:2'-5' RNA ligase family protein [Acidobacteriota bacterium]
MPETEATKVALTELARQQDVISVEVTRVIPLGQGVAYNLESPSLQRLRAQLADRFAPHLIPQDRQPFRPHVVIQNKATAELARRTLAEIAQRFVPFSVQGLGLDLWQYLNGPWAFQKTFLFRLPASS